MLYYEYNLIRISRLELFHYYLFLYLAKATQDGLLLTDANRVRFFRKYFSSEQMTYWKVFFILVLKLVNLEMSVDVCVFLF